MRPEGRDAVLKVVAETLKSLDRPAVGIVYGSAARDQLADHSDIDVAVGVGERLDFEARSFLYRRLCDALHREVDLIDLESLEGYLWEPLWDEGKFVLWDHNLVVKYAGKAQAFHEDVKPAWLAMVDHRLEKAFGGV